MGTVTWVGDALEKLALCLCAQIIADGSSSPCFCGVVPGNGIPPDLSGCDDDVCGAAYVKLLSSYPSSAPGIVDQNPGNCGVAIGIDVEVGVYRCFPIMADASLPSADTLLEVTRQQMADMESMRTALTCCDWLPSRDVVVGQYNPLGPDGDVVGGSFQVFAQVFGG